VARGAAFVLLGTTISVAGESFDLFTKLYGDRPRFLEIIATSSTEKHARLIKYAFQSRFKGQPPIVKINVAPVEDLNSLDDFVSFSCHVSDVIAKHYHEAFSRKEREFPMLLTITGGRKSMSIAAYVIASHLGIRVFDVRSSSWDEDKAINSMINNELKMKDPEKVYKEKEPYVNEILFRSADIYYELPRVILDRERTDGRVIECLEKVLS